MSPREKDGLESFTFRLPAEDAAKLRAVSAELDRSVSSVLRLAVRSYLRGKRLPKAGGR